MTPLPARALRRDDSTNDSINHWWTLLLYGNTPSFGVSAEPTLLLG